MYVCCSNVPRTLSILKIIRQSMVSMRRPPKCAGCRPPFLKLFPWYCQQARLKFAEPRNQHLRSMHARTLLFSFVAVFLLADDTGMRDAGASSRTRTALHARPFARFAGLEPPGCRSGF